MPRQKKPVRRRPLPDPPSGLATDPELAFEVMKSEMPDVAAEASFGPMSWLEQFLYGKPNQVATTWPGGNIRYNPKVMKRAIDRKGLRADDVVAHEMAHVRQEKEGGLLGTLYNIITADPEYLNRTNEQEAFAFEKARAAKRRDIPLP